MIVEEGSVISMGVYIGQSTRIYDRETGEIHYGRVPAGSVVVSGNLPSKDGKYSLYCAVIVKKVDAKTRGKVGINELLRTIDCMHTGSTTLPDCFLVQNNSSYSFFFPFLNTFHLVSDCHVIRKTKINVLIHPMEYRHNKAGNF